MNQAKKERCHAAELVSAQAVFLFLCGRLGELSAGSVAPYENPSGEPSENAKRKFANGKMEWYTFDSSRADVKSNIALLFTKE